MNKIFECSITKVPVDFFAFLEKNPKHRYNSTWKHNLETFELFRNFATMNVKKVMMYRGESESLTLIILDQPTNHLSRSNKTDIERTYHFCVKSSWYQFQAEIGGLSASMDEVKTQTRTRAKIFVWTNMKMHVHCILIDQLESINSIESE